MKKTSFVLLAGALLSITACNNTSNSQYTDAQIDSMVNARVDELRVQMMAQNDSMINALAAQKADSIIAAMKAGASTPPAPTHTTKPTTVKHPTPISHTDDGTKSNTDRPGATNTGGVKTNTDRPGATNTGGVKTNSDRPGATKVPATGK